MTDTAITLSFASPNIAVQVVQPPVVPLSMASALRGEQGDPGIQGATGAQGPAGPQGPQGEAGPQGLQGAVGPQGIQGPSGNETVGGFPISVTSPQTGEVLAFMGDAWTNVNNFEAVTLNAGYF